MDRGISGPLALIAAAFVAGAMLGMMATASQVDVDQVYCEASADGWRAAHVRLYEYIEATNKEYFDRAFMPMTPNGRQTLVDSCLEDPDGIRQTLQDIMAQVDGTKLPSNGK